MKIDAHQHFWNYDSIRDSWITDTMSLLRRDFSPDDLTPELAANSIDASVAVQAAQSEEETRYLLELADNSEHIAGVVGWVDLCSATVEERLQSFSKFEKLLGLRHIVQAEPDKRFLLRQEFLRGIRLLRQFDFTYDILVYPRQLPAAVELTAMFPDQRFVIDHMAKPEITARKTEEWTAHMRSIAANPNVYCKVSGLVTEADWKGWRAEDFKYYLDVVFEVFGTHRLMFGSDWPVCLLAASYRQVVGLVENYVRSNAPADLEDIFGGNAVRFYKLKAIPNGSTA
ncbi:MAG: amidohydrolase family protein [Candidatus Acidiferrum sp.]